MKALPSSARPMGKVKPQVDSAAGADNSRKMKASERSTRPMGKVRPKIDSASGASKSRKVAASSEGAGSDASRLIDRRIRDVGGWRGETLARMRSLILDADPAMKEECKWVKPTNPSGVPVWSHAGMVCTGEIYTKAVKLTFAHGAAIPDPSGLFNASLEGGTRRAIDIHEGQTVDPRAFKALVKAAVAFNEQSAKKR